MARYRKIDVRIWNDEKFSSLSDYGQLVFLYVLTHPTMTALGAMRGTPEGLAGEKYGWDKASESLRKAFQEGFREVFEKGLLKVDQRGLIFAPNFLKYNVPESPNVVKGWASALDYLPECPMLAEVISRAKSSVESLSEAFRKAFKEAFGEAFEKALPNQEQEQKQEQEYKAPPEQAAKKFVSKPAASINFYDIPAALVADWQTARKAQKAPITQTVIDGFAKEARKAGISLEEAVRISIERGWRGFKADWVKGDKEIDNPFRVKPSKPVQPQPVPEDNPFRVKPAKTVPPWNIGKPEFDEGVADMVGRMLG